MTIRPLILLPLLIVSSAACKHGDATKSLAMGQFVKHDDVSDTLTNAQHLHASGDIEGAISLLKTLTAKPYHPGHDRAYELLVEWLLQLNKTSEAKGVASYFLRTHKESASTKTIVALFDSFERANQSAVAPVDTSTSEESSTEPTMSFEPSESSDQLDEENPAIIQKSESLIKPTDGTSSLDVKKKFHLQVT